MNLDQERSANVLDRQAGARNCQPMNRFQIHALFEREWISINQVLSYVPQHLPNSRSFVQCRIARIAKHSLDASANRRTIRIGMEPFSEVPLRGGSRVTLIRRPNSIPTRRRISRAALESA